MAEEVLIKLEIEKGNGEQQVDNMTKKIVGLQTANKDLVKQNKELEKQGKQNTQQYIENTRQIEVNKQKISEATATRKGLIQTLVAEDNSIKALKQRNAELLKQRDSLSTSTAKGKAQIAAINKEMEANTKTIITNSNAQEKQRANIGNYASALDNIIPGLGGMTQGIVASTQAAWAFVATPIGAILAAIAVVVAGVVAYFKQFESVLDVIEDVTTQATAAFSAMIQNLDKVASIIGNVLIGNFGKAAVSLGELTSEIKNAASEAQRLLEMTRDLEDAEMRYRVANAAAVNEMKAYVVASRNKNLSIEESFALLQKASDIENELTRQAVDNAQKRADIEEGKLVASKRTQLEAANVLREANETQAQYIQRLIESGVFSPEALEPLIAAYEKVEQEASAGLAFQEKIANQQAALEERQAARAENLQKEIEKQRELNAAVDEWVEKFIESLEAPRLAFEEERQRQEERTQMANDFIAQVGVNTDISLNLAQREHDRKKQLVEQENAFRRKSLEMKKEFDQAALQSSVGLFGAMSALFKKESAEQKAFALAQIVANSAIGVSNAVKAGSGIPWPANLAAILSGVAAVLAGIAQAKALLKFAQGGLVPGYAGGGLSGTRIMSHHGSPIQRSNGDNRLATVKTGEVILNRRQQAALGGDDTFRRIGVPGFATGGAIESGNATRIAASEAQNRMDLNQLAGLVNNVRTVLVLQDFETVQTQKEQIINKAQVI